MKFCGHKKQRFAEALSARGRLNPNAYPNSQGELERFLAAKVFSLKFQPLQVLERMSFVSISLLCCLRRSALESAKSDSTSWPSTSFRILSAAFLCSYS